MLLERKDGIHSVERELPYDFVICFFKVVADSTLPHSCVICILAMTASITPARRSYLGRNIKVHRKMSGRLGLFPTSLSLANAHSRQQWRHRSGLHLVQRRFLRWKNDVVGRRRQVFLLMSLLPWVLLLSYTQHLRTSRSWTSRICLPQCCITSTMLSGQQPKWRKAGNKTTEEGWATQWP